MMCTHVVFLLFLHSSDAWLHLVEVKCKALLMLSTHLLDFRQRT